jgi:hypothetical protein
VVTGGEPRPVGGLLPAPGGGYPQFTGDDGRPWCVVLHAPTDCEQAGLGGVLVIFEPGMTYDRAVRAAGETLPGQHPHVVPVRTAAEWSGRAD